MTRRRLSEAADALARLMRGRDHAVRVFDDPALAEPWPASPCRVTDAAGAPGVDASRLARIGRDWHHPPPAIGGVTRLARRPLRQLGRSGGRIPLEKVP